MGRQAVEDVPEVREGIDALPSGAILAAGQRLELVLELLDPPLRLPDRVRLLSPQRSELESLDNDSPDALERIRVRRLGRVS